MGQQPVGEVVLQAFIVWSAFDQFSKDADAALDRLVVAGQDPGVDKEACSKTDHAEILGAKDA